MMMEIRERSRTILLCSFLLLFLLFPFNWETSVFYNSAKWIPMCLCASACAAHTHNYMHRIHRNTLNCSAAAAVLFYRRTGVIFSFALKMCARRAVINDAIQRGVCGVWSVLCSVHCVRCDIPHKCSRQMGNVNNMLRRIHICIAHSHTLDSCILYVPSTENIECAFVRTQTIIYQHSAYTYKYILCECALCNCAWHSKQERGVSGLTSHDANAYRPTYHIPKVQCIERERESTPTSRNASAQ